MIFAIPSYKRPNHQTTYKYLQDIGVDKTDIYVFVQCEADYKSYKEAGIGNVTFQSEKHNVSGNRNNVLDYFPKNTNIIMLDDDIKGIYVKGQDMKVKKVEAYSELGGAFENAFEECKRRKTCLFGVNQSHNGLYLNHTISTRCMISVLYGIINTDVRFDENLDLYEDAELCCQVIRKYGSVVRLNHIGIDNSREIAGGCKEFYETENKRSESFRYLLLKYSDLLEFDPSKKNQKINFKRGNKK